MVSESWLHIIISRLFFKIFQLILNTTNHFEHYLWNCIRIIYWWIQKIQAKPDFRAKKYASFRHGWWWTETMSKKIVFLIFYHLSSTFHFIIKEASFSLSHEDCCPRIELSELCIQLVGSRRLTWFRSCAHLWTNPCSHMERICRWAYSLVPICRLIEVWRHSITHGLNDGGPKHTWSLVTGRTWSVCSSQRIEINKCSQKILNYLISNKFYFS